MVAARAALGEGAAEANTAPRQATKTRAYLSEGTRMPLRR